MKRIILSLLIVSFYIKLIAQTDSVQYKSSVDSIQHMNMDASYNRPFRNVGRLPLAIGGYAEVNWQHLGTNGVSEGHQFQFRRLSIFMSSTITRKIKFLSEIEFEEGGKEVSIEFAAVDFEFHPLVNLRGGIVLNPIGSFNQNHDGPKWEFTDRPIAMTELLPATFSNPGFGIFGRQYQKEWMFGYELYITAGLNNAIIDNEKGRTSLPSVKEKNGEEDESSNALYSTKLSLKNKKFGEVGLSWMGGIYNTWQQDGIELDEKRSSNAYAVDYTKSIVKTNTVIAGEWAWVNTEIPSTYSQQYGSKQQGGYIDIVQRLIKFQLNEWKDALINVACRVEYIDWNVATFKENGDNIGDDLWSVMPGISFRPCSQTVLRLNYRYMEQNDLFDNPPDKTGGFSFGISSCF